MEKIYNFYINKLGLHLQLRYDGWYTSFCWYKKNEGKPVVVESVFKRETRDVFFNRVAKLKLCNL